MKSCWIPLRHFGFDAIIEFDGIDPLGQRASLQLAAKIRLFRPVLQEPAQFIGRAEHLLEEKAASLGIEALQDGLGR